MSLPDVRELLYDDGVYADPIMVTEIGRVLQNASSRAVASSMIVKQSPGLLFGATVSSVSAQFIQIFDAATLPADGAVPTIPPLAVAATNQVGIAWIPPRSFRQGIVICNSSTQHTKTIGSADCLFDVQFI